MNARTVTSIVFILTALTSCGQGKYGISKTHAFYTERIAGTVMVDGEGRQLPARRDTTYTIYVETNNTNIKWLKAWIKGQSFTVQAKSMGSDRVEAGVEKYGERKFVLKPAAGHQLWLLQLQSDNVSSKSPSGIKSGEIIVQGRSGKKTFTFKISPMVELEGLPSV